MKNLMLARFRNRLGWKNRFARGIWCLTNFILVRPAVSRLMWPWRRFMFRLFGARLDPRSNIYPSAKVWAPWNLEMGAYSCLGDDVRMYNTGRVVLGDQVTVSQGAYLCPGSHDISDPFFPMICSDMVIEDQVWIATEAFVGGRSIRIGQGAVIAARAVVFESVAPWAVVAGNPARVVKQRIIRGA